MKLMSNSDNGHRGAYRDLNEAFILAARRNSVVEMQRLLGEGADVNYKDDFGMTSLHHVASIGARTSLRFLLASGKCDFLVADNATRYPSDLAIEWSRDFAVARLLTRKRLVQATAENKPAREPR